MLTTEALVADIKEETKAAGGGGAPGGPGGMGGMYASPATKRVHNRSQMRRAPRSKSYWAPCSLKDASED